MLVAFCSLTSCNIEKCYACTLSTSTLGVETITTFDFCEGEDSAVATVTTGVINTKKTIPTKGFTAQDFEKQGYTCKKK